MEWNDETIVRLRAFWNDGLSTAEIGRRIGVSKNAVVGKAHRLGLSARPSPIRRNGPGAPEPRPAAPRRVVGPTLPPLAAALSADTHLLPPRAIVKPATAPAHTASAQTASPQIAQAQTASAQIAPLPAPPLATAAVRLVPPRPSRVAACCWPLGEPGTRSFRFCDAEAPAGKPYAGEHALLAYVKVRDRREEVA